MHQALYRKWRPSTFDDVCGQEHITSILKYEIDKNKTTHAYLFCGSRGTGKTTCAKILAKAVNCEHTFNGNPCNECPSCRAIDSGLSTDVYEMDAASNNGIDNIRDIRDEVIYTPSELKNRVYIIDEVHMLSVSAFNALLKTLEEPPENVIFILATTELQKIPATVLSRCQRFDFRRIPTKTIADRLEYIAGNEGMEIESDAAFLIAKLAQGGMRDAISMLELCSGEHSKITKDIVISTTGINGRDSIINTVNAILKRDFEALLAQINLLYTSSLDITVFWNDLLAFYRDMFVFKNTKNPAAYLDLSDGELEELKTVCGQFGNATILNHIKELEDCFCAMQRPNSSKRITAEMTLIRMCDNKLSHSSEALLERISNLEDMIKSGNLAGTPLPSSDATAPSSIKTQPTVITDRLPSSAAESPDTSHTSEESKASGEKVQMSTEQSEESEKKVFRPLDCWPEVVKRYHKTDISTATFLEMSYAYISGSDIVIRVPGRFTADVISQSEVKEKLASLISVTADSMIINQSNIKIEINPDKPVFDSDSGIEELMNNNR